MGRFLLIGLIAGGAMAFFGYQQMTLKSGCKPTPTAVKLEKLTQNGAEDGNRNVTVTGLLPAPDFVYSEKKGRWQYVYIPLMTPDLKVSALVKSFKPKNQQEVESFAVGIALTGLSGLVTNDIRSMGSGERSKFEASHPGVDFAKLPIVEEGKTPPSDGEVYGLLGGGLVLFVGSAVGGLLRFKKSRG